MQEHNKGLDLLRILSMYMVVILHVLSRGAGLLTKLVSGSLGWKIAWLLEIACYCAVNCFVLITGYLMISRVVKVSSIVTLWLQVLFYSVGITLLYLIVKPEDVSVLACIKSIFPVIGQQYWYFTAYFAMFLLLPFVNQLLRQLKKGQFTVLIVILIGLFSVLNTVSFGDCFKIENGYSVVWMLTVYTIGAYIKRFNVFTKKPIFLFAVYMFVVLLTWLVKIFSITVPIVEWEGIIVNRVSAILSSALIAYSSPTILLAAVCLFVNFKQMKGCTPKWLRKISQMTFSVYLIHTHPLIFDNIFADAFVFIYELPGLLQPLVVLLIAIDIFVICLIIEYIRQWLFRLCQIRKIAELIEQMIGRLNFCIINNIISCKEKEIQ